MTVTLERPRPAPPEAPPPFRDWDDGRGGRREPEHVRPLRLLAALVVAAAAMFFFGLVSALVARAASMGWTSAPRPPVLWLGTAALLASSLLLELGRSALERGEAARGARALRWGGLLGLGFLGGQVSAWWWLVSSGVGLATSPGASYFYVLSGAHLLHVAGGLVLWGRVLQGVGNKLRGEGPLLWALRLYWHFLAGLWVFLFALLFFR